MTGHTEGPWIVHPDRAWVSPAFDLEMPVCQMRHPAPDLPEEQVFATARLIAAAPDLLAALELLVGEELGGDAHSHKPSEAYRAYIDWNDRAAARAAIARAKGDAA